MAKSKRRVVHAGFGAALFTVTILSGLTAMPAAAQEKKSEKQVELGAITVTAQKQEENVQEVPTSITVMDEVDIEDRKIEYVREVIDFAPNLMTFNDGMAGFESISTRGISAPSMASQATSTAIYMDGVPTLGSYGSDTSITDIERIEVLRGPQGTLYGKNTEAGAINIITRQPTNEFRGKVSVEGGQLLSSESDDKLTGGVTLSLSGPIQKDKFFLNLAGNFTHKDGYIHNTYLDKDVYSKDTIYSRVKLRATPTDALDISLLLSYFSYETDGGTNMNLGPKGAAMFMLPTPSHRQISSDNDGKQSTDTDIESLHVSYDINDSMTLTSISSRKKTTFDGAMDFDFSPMHIMHGFQDGTNVEQYSQELRLNSSSDKLNWLVGLYYDHSVFFQNMVTTSAMMPMMNSAMDTELTGDSYAIFGQAGYSLTEQLKIIGGLRYENQDMDITGVPTGNLNDSWEKVSPKIAVEYNFNPDIMTYVNVAQGYRSGGFNQLSMDPQYYSYDAESLWSYEVGLKSLFLDKKLMINAAVYYMDITDMQVEEAVNPYLSWITNAAEATSQGIELEITARLTDGLSLMGGFGYTDIEFDKFSDALGNYEGNKKPFAPEYTFNIGAQYRHVSGFYARSDFIGYGEMFLDKTNKYSRDAYQIVNAKIGYEAQNFDIYLYGKNIFEEEYDADGYYGGSYVVYSDPGEVGLQLTYRF